MSYLSLRDTPIEYRGMRRYHHHLCGFLKVYKKKARSRYLTFKFKFVFLDTCADHHRDVTNRMENWDQSIFQIIKKKIIRLKTQKCVFKPLLPNLLHRRKKKIERLR